MSRSLWILRLDAQRKNGTRARLPRGSGQPFLAAPPCEEPAPRFSLPSTAYRFREARMMKRLPMKRRTALCVRWPDCQAVPLLRASNPASVQAHAQESLSGRDVIEELGVRSFINAAGTFTALTGSPACVRKPSRPCRSHPRKFACASKISVMPSGKRIAELLHCPRPPW